MAVIYYVYTDNKLPHMTTEGITLMACLGKQEVYP